MENMSWPVRETNVIFMEEKYLKLKRPAWKIIFSIKKEEQWIIQKETMRLRNCYVFLLHIPLCIFHEQMVNINMHLYVCFGHLYIHKVIFMDIKRDTTYFLERCNILIILKIELWQWIINTLYCTNSQINLGFQILKKKWCQV